MTSLTLTCLTASSGGKFTTLFIWVSTQAFTAALESLYCCQSLHACWYRVQRASNSALVSSQACTASFTAASTLSRTSAAQLSRRGSAAARNSPMRTSRAPKSPFKPCRFFKKKIGKNIIYWNIYIYIYCSTFNICIYEHFANIRNQTVVSLIK